MLHTITIPSCSRVRVTYVGEFRLWSGLLLKEVLYVPEFKYNLISLHKLIQDMYYDVSFNLDTCVVQGHSMKRTIVLGRFNGLYFAQREKNHLGSSVATSFITAECKTPPLKKEKLWHIRLGQLPFD